MTAPPTTANQYPLDGVITVTVHDRVGIITLNRPEARNASSAEVQRLLPELVAALDADDNVDVLVLTGADLFSAPASTSRNWVKGRPRPSRRLRDGADRCPHAPSRSSARSTASP